MEQMTIDEVARKAGTTSRNIRAYQERGLVPPPEVVGRTGYYNDGHAARLRHIATLLERGFSLAAIRALFDAWEQGYGLADVLGFEEALAAPWASETSASVRLKELLQWFGGDESTLAKAVDLGFIEPDGDRYRVTSPRLLEAARRLVEAGLPLPALLDEAERLIADLDVIAERWATLFKYHLWADSLERGMPPSELQALTDLLRGMRDLMGAIVGPLFAQAMERRVAELAADTIASTPKRRAGTKRRAAAASRG